MYIQRDYMSFNLLKCKYFCSFIVAALKQRTIQIMCIWKCLRSQARHSRAQFFCLWVAQIPSEDNAHEHEDDIKYMLSIFTHSSLHSLYISLSKYEITNKRQLWNENSVFFCCSGSELTVKHIRGAVEEGLEHKSSNKQRICHTRTHSLTRRLTLACTSSSAHHTPPPSQYCVYV